TMRCGCASPPPPPTAPWKASYGCGVLSIASRKADNLMTPSEQRVLGHIDLGEITSIARALIAAPGENPPRGDGPTARGLIGVAEELGLVTSTTEVEPDRPNVSATLPGGTESGVLLLGHTDVVPVGDGWTVSPTGGEIVGDRLYGRGSTDMKG